MRLLFVCTGNSCRSPMAEVIARSLAPDLGLPDIVVESAGVGAVDGSPASDGALLVAMEHGLDLGQHRARQATRPIVAAADLILTMGESHARQIRELGGEGRTFVLPDYATSGTDRSNVRDPFGADLEVYRSTFAELQRYVEMALRRTTSDGASR